MSRTPEAGGRSLVGPVFMLLACLFLWASQLTFDAGDWPGPNRYPHPEVCANACGKVGAFTAYHLRRVIGDGVYPLALFATCAAAVWLVRGRIQNPVQRLFGLAVVVASTSASVHLVAAPGPNALEFGNGGILGAALGPLLKESFAGVGTVLVLAYCFAVGLIFTAEGWVLKLSGAIGRAARASGEAIASTRALLPAPQSDAVVVPARTLRIERTAAKAADPPVPDDDTTEPLRLRFHGTHEATRKKHRKQDDTPTLFDDVLPGEQADDDAPTSRAPAGRKQRARKQSAGASPARASASKTDDPSPASGERAVFDDQDGVPAALVYPQRLGKWKYPPLTLLDNPEYSFTTAQESVLRAKAKTLERALREFRLDARVVEIDTGPVITLFELDLGAGIKVSQISSLANDIARALKAPSVRIIAPIPGKGTVGVEVPNVDKEIVRLKGLMLSCVQALKTMAIPLLLGKDASGNPLVADLSTMPHMLIAGTTGSGKSVSINSIIMSVLMSRRPDIVKLILIDPKMVEMSQFKDVPHLMAPIVTDMHRAEQILEWAVTKMDERYAQIAEARVRNIDAYNRLGEEELFARLHADSEEDRKRIATRLPHIVIIIDELADLMMTSAKEVEHHLSRLAQKSRAVGIHIVVATQRPEAKVVTGLIKSNLPCRCAFRVASRMDSRIVMDQNGAEVLMGQGDMLFLPPGEHKLIRAQGTFVDDREIHRVIDCLTAQGRPTFHPELVRMRSKNRDISQERDPLFDRAVEIVMETKRGSVSLLQRRLTVGYSRASRLIEEMADAGIVGDYKGSQAREVAITPDEWERMKAAAEQTGCADRTGRDEPRAASGAQTPRRVASSGNEEDADDWETENGNPDDDPDVCDARGTRDEDNNDGNGIDEGDGPVGDDVGERGQGADSA